MCRQRSRRASLDTYDSLVSPCALRSRRLAGKAAVAVPVLLEDPTVGRQDESPPLYSKEWMRETSGLIISKSTLDKHHDQQNTQKTRLFLTMSQSRQDRLYFECSTGEFEVRTAEFCSFRSTRFQPSLVSSLGSSSGSGATIYGCCCGRLCENVGIDPSSFDTAKD